MTVLGCFRLDSQTNVIIFLRFENIMYACISMTFKKIVLLEMRIHEMHNDGGGGGVDMICTGGCYKRDFVVHNLSKPALS